MKKNGNMLIVVSVVLIIVSTTLIFKTAEFNLLYDKLNNIITEQAYQRKVLDRLWYDFYCSDCHDNKELWEVKG